MQVLLDPGLDVEGWTGIGRGAARFGVHEVGPLGFARALATRLGINSRTEARALREVALANRLDRGEGNTAARYRSARRLLRARDELAMAGAHVGALDGETLARPRALLELCSGLADGDAELMARVARADLKRAGIDAVTLLAPREGLPGVTRATLAALEDAGVEVTWKPASRTRAAGDLGEAQAGSAVFRGDDTVRVERSRGEWLLAERAARALREALDRELFELDDVVIIEPSLVLSRALQVYGLPRTPTKEEGAGRARDRFLALLALAGLLDRPPRAVDLRVAIDFAPLLPATRARLLRLTELHHVPRQVQLDDEIHALSDADPVVRALFAHATTPGWESARHRLAVFSRWSKDPRARQFASHVRAAMTLAERSGESTLALSSIIDACARTAAPVTHAGDAGFAVARRADALVAPARVVVWTLTKSPARPATNWRDNERAALDAHGFELPAPELAHRRQARPLENARERLWVFALDGVGQPTVDRLPSARPRPTARRAHNTRARPPFRVHVEDDAIPRPRSPSALARFIACPLRYSLERIAPPHDEPGDSAHLLARRIGTLAHEIIAAWLSEGEPAARARAALYDLVATERADRLLATIDHAKITLARVLEDAGARVVGVEVEGSDADLEGRADLLIEVDGTRGVIDLKWSGAPRWRRELREGALQLLVYAHLFDAALMGVFIIDEARLLVVGDQAAIAGAEHIRAAAPRAQALEEHLARVGRAWGEQTAGNWHAPPAVGGSQRACRSCAWDDVCGLLGRR